MTLDDPDTPHSRYTHGHHESVLRSHNRRTAENSAAYLLGHLEPGMSLLDVGCGPGTITVDLARHVAPGKVLGIDTGEGVIDTARAAAAADRATTATTGAQPPPVVDFQHRDLADFDESDGPFDVVHAHQVLQHVPDPVGALRHMRRLAAPGGIVAARDADYSGMIWYPRLPELDRWMELYQRVARSNGGEPDAARHLKSWARAAGFPDVTVTASTWCYADEADRAWWGGMWADRIVESSIAQQMVDGGLATIAELQQISRAWRTWAAAPDGYFAIVHGEILCHASRPG